MSSLPLRDIERRLGASFLPYGPADAAPDDRLEVAASFGEYEAEYAAIRRHVGILHLPPRGILHFTGADRLDFLHRMLTQDLRSRPGGSTVRSFQLNEKGRIVADVIVHHGDLSTWLEVDRFDVEPLRALLEKRLFAEDVQIEDLTAQRVPLALHGPASAALLRAVVDEGDASGPMTLPGTHHVLPLAGARATVYRWDDAGSPGLRLLVPAERAGAVYEALLSASGFEPGAGPDAELAERRRQSLRGRPIGWLAYNTARIEAGSPLFHVDFGTDSLPAETGLLDDTTSFTKGCYLGQEIVTRMKNLGHPRRLLVGLAFPTDALPVAGTQVLDPAEKTRVIGAITSSTVSPLRSAKAIALAVMKWGQHEPGAKVLAPAEGALVEGEVTARRFID